MCTAHVVLLKLPVRYEFAAPSPPAPTPATQPRFPAPSHRPAARDILLPRLPAPALDLIVPALPPATRAALRLCCRQLRALVDAHTQSLTLRPDRGAADALNRRGAKVRGCGQGRRRASVWAGMRAHPQLG